MIVYEQLVLVVLALVALGAGLFLLLLLHHAVVSWRIRRARLRETVLTPLVCQAIADPESSSKLLGQLRRSDRGVLLAILLRLALDLRGADGEAIARLAEEAGLVRWEMRRLSRSRRSGRAAAAKNLGTLRIRAALPMLLQLLKHDQDIHVRLAGVWALGEIEGRGAVMGLLSMLEDRAPGVVRRAQEILLRSAQDATGEIVSYVRSSPVAAARCAAVEVLGVLRDPLATDLLLELVNDSHPELRIKAAKAAALIADPRFFETFQRLLGDSLWEVRCQAAKGLGALGAEGAIPSLRSALADTAWWVRFNAAVALSQLGAPGRSALREALRDPRPGSCEIARYILERYGLLGTAA